MTIGTQRYGTVLNRGAEAQYMSVHVTEVP